MRKGLYPIIMAACLVSWGLPGGAVASGHGEAYSIARGGRLYDK